MSDKKRVLFVDDEPNLLAGLRRMLRSMRKEWEMKFAPGGAEALAMMQDNPPDVIVSDMRMPGMDGTELLQQVMHQSPQTVRVVLSGQAEREAVLRGAAAIHQYLGKPCDADTLKETVQQACSLAEQMPNADVRQVLSQLDPFSALPLSLDDVIAQLKDADTPVKGLSHLVSSKIGIDAGTVQYIDSALSSLRTHIPGPAQASVLLGLNTLKLLGVSAQAFQQYQQPALGAVAVHGLWKHGILVGEIAVQIARAENAPPDVVDFAAVAGLLHDIGKFIFTGYFWEAYKTVRETMKREQLDAQSAEMDAFGANHADVGAYLLALWGLPQPVVDAVKYHNTAPKNGSGTMSAPLAVYIANALEHEIRTAQRVDISEKLDMAYLETIGVAHRLPVWREVCRDCAMERVA